MRCQVYIPKELEEVLLNDAKKAGVNVSEIIIRILTFESIHFWFDIFPFFLWSLRSVTKNDL